MTVIARSPVARGLDTRSNLPRPFDCVRRVDQFQCNLPVRVYDA